MVFSFPVSEAAAKAVTCRLRKRRSAVAPGFGSAVGTGMPFTRFGSRRQSRQLQAAKGSFEWPQKATLGTGGGASEALSRPACHGVSRFGSGCRSSQPRSESDASKASFSSGLRKRRPSAAGSRATFLAGSESDVKL